jgi:hypothetical protein
VNAAVAKRVNEAGPLAPEFTIGLVVWQGAHHEWEDRSMEE